MEKSHQQSVSIAGALPAPDDAARNSESDAAAIRQIIRVMKQLLATGPLSPESRFIDLTSNVKKAFAFVREFQRLFDYDLPLSAFFDAPTIRDLARIAVTRVTPPLTRLVLLRSGDAGVPPLFLVPGLGGVIFEMLGLAKQLAYAGSIYGFAAPGLDGVDPPCTDVTGMSEGNFHLARLAYPAGPYRFLGYSFGGVVAFEMTRCAAGLGAKVDFLGALDSNFVERSWPFTIWLRHMARRASQPHRRASRTASPAAAAMPGIGQARLPEDMTRLVNLRKKIFRTIGPVLAMGDTLMRVKRKIDHRYFSDLSSAAYLTADPYYIADLPPKFQRVRDAAIEMAGAYRVRHLDCELYLFRAASGDALSCDPVLTWSRVVRCIILRPVPGNHATMLRQPHVKHVARDVSLCLAQVEKARLVMRG